MDHTLGIPLSPGPQAMTAAKPAPPTLFVVFGAHGDLTQRLLIPALYNLDAAGLLGPGFQILGIDGRMSDTALFQEAMRDAVHRFCRDRRAATQPVHQEALDRLIGRMRYQQADVLGDVPYQTINDALTQTPANAVFYLAIAARFFGPIATRLNQAGLLDERAGARRVIVEKPFGSSLSSARALNAELRGCMKESQIYRIDHYLGKETVQNIMALRFSNGFFEPMWKRDHIDHVQISVAETVGVESRAAFYEHTGALRDMIPNHLFQLLSMVAMEPPSSFEADAVRAEKAKVLHAIRPFSEKRVRQVVLGQYTQGQQGPTRFAGYRQEPGVAPDSDTETFVAMRVDIDNWRWAGVPFYLRTGKRMGVRSTEIAIHFKPAPFTMFRNTSVGSMTPNILKLHIQPSEGITLQFNAKVPGQTLQLGGVSMAFNYADHFPSEPSTGYETLVYDCLIGDATLFQRADAIEAGWAAVQPILTGWAERSIPVDPYPAGHAGPDSSVHLLERDGRNWLDLTP